MDWIRYANQGATRNLPLDPQLAGALDFLPELGLTMEVFSGGQPARGSGRPRVGSTRHDHGKAADVFFYRDGRRLDWSNPDDIPTYQEIVRRGRAKGLTGFGAGPNYMQPGSMHIGFGNEAVWGAGGKGENAPGWLREAYEGVSTRQPRGLLASAGGNTTMAGGQGADTMQAPQQVPQMAQKPRRASLFDRLEGVPFFGGLADPDKRARLAMALEGMTLNPNEALMANYQGEIDQRADDERINATADWLAQQPGAEMYAEAIRTGQIDPASAFSAYLQSIQEPEPLKPTGNMQDVQDLINRGMPQDEAIAAVFGGNGPAVVNNVGGATINEASGPPDDAKLRDKLMTNQGEQWGTFLQAGVTASGMTQDLEILEGLVDVVPSGPISGRLAQMVPGVSSAGAAFESVVKRAAPALRVEGSGATSDIEYNGFLQSFPSLLNKPEANRAIIAVLRSKAQINKERADIVAQYQNGQIEASEANALINDINNRSIMTPEITAALSAVAGQDDPTMPGPVLPPRADGEELSDEELSDEELRRFYGVGD